MPTLPSVSHAVLYSGVVQKVHHIWLHLLPPKGCTVLAQAGSHHTRAHPTHKGQLTCSNHSTERRLCTVKIAFSFLANYKNYSQKFQRMGGKHQTKAPMWLSEIPLPSFRMALSSLWMTQDCLWPLHCDHQLPGVSHRAAIKQI